MHTADFLLASPQSRLRSLGSLEAEKTKLVT